jgi:hypothetical protein
MEDQKIDNPEKKAFFQTIPGILTGFAGLITAIGGFIIVLNKVGCMEISSSDKHQSADSKSAATPPVNIDTPVLKNSASEKPLGVNNQKASITFSPAEVKNFKSKLIFKIKEATIQSSGQDLIFNIKIKCLNEDNTAYYFYPNYIRVKNGEDKYPPDASSESIERQQVNSQSFTNLEYNFKLPGDIREFQLLLFDDYTQADPVLFKVN